MLSDFRQGYDLLRGMIGNNCRSINESDFISNSITHDGGRYDSDINCLSQIL
jgi:hypothetical protein